MIPFELIEVTPENAHDVVRRVAAAELVSLDTEVAGVDFDYSPYRNGKLACMQLGWREGNRVCAAFIDATNIEPFREWLASSQMKCGHNIRGFDDHQLTAAGYHLAEPIFDSMRASRIVYASGDKSQSHKLKSLMMEILGWPAGKEFAETFRRPRLRPENPAATPKNPGATLRHVIKGGVPTLLGAEASRVSWKSYDVVDISGDLSPEWRRVLIDYAVKDAVATLLVSEHLMRVMKAMPAGKGTLLDMYWQHWAPAVATLHDMMERGVAIDVEAIADARMLAAVDMEQYASGFAEWAPGVNPNSAQQLAQLFYGQKKFRVPTVCGSRKNPRKTPKGHKPTDQVALDRLLASAKEHDDKLGLGALIQLRETDKLNRYLLTLPDHAKEGRIHAMFAPDTDTGRLACSAPALQQIPKDERYGLRRMFVAKPGHVLVAADMSQLELRVAAHLLIKKFGDSRLADDLQARDIHSVAAKRAWPDKLEGIDVSEIKNHADPAIAKLREWAKAVIYGLFYGKSEVGLSVQLGIDKETAAAVKSSIMAAYGVDRYQEWVQDFAAAKGYVTTLLGRRRQLVAATGEMGPAYFAAMRQAMNTPIQGSAADLMMIAMTRVDRALPGTLVLQIHDELVLEVPEADLDRARRDIKVCMESVSEFLMVPLIANVGHGRNWEQCK